MGIVRYSPAWHGATVVVVSGVSPPPGATPSARRGEAHSSLAAEPAPGGVDAGDRHRRAGEPDCLVGRIVRPVCPSGNRYHGAVPEPPVIAYGRTLDADTWWAVLPSGAVVRRDGLNDLLLAVERVMAEEQPGRIFSFSLDSTGLWDPGDPEPTERGPEPTSAKG